MRVSVNRLFFFHTLAIELARKKIKEDPNQLFLDSRAVSVFVPIHMP